MGQWGEDVERAYAAWARGREVAAEPLIRDRGCVHYTEGTPAEPYAGQDYLRALQRLRGGEAEQAARRVEPFFWSDAKATRVWLCGECSARLGLRREEN
jgi:hypothetical protein